ncbi:hypothetical protein EQ875_01632 [Photobacterium damselae subsp. damselae]|uniref:hypothetical protein n=1 Tax=Photobacterium damselae TaxID=38293 RepID=UPI00109BEBA7|nr:hypothetical protein [Photobacterium damselae]TGZ35351.1 hypothetical protein EQ875_01632 [Photobacterium damselae subsp. damselae]
MIQLTEFQNKTLSTIAERRKIGKAGLPQELIRDEQVKVRFTESDRAVIDTFAKNVDTNEAQFLYTLAISSVRDMMINDAGLAQEIKHELLRAGIVLPEWMQDEHE